MTRAIGRCLLLLLLLAGCGNEILYDDLDQREANQLVSILRQSGIHAERVAEGEGRFSVTVVKDDFVEAIRVLEQHGLPRKRFKTMVDVFNSDSLLSTPLEERARLAYALSQELTQSLISIDGVMDAYVHLTLSRDRPLSKEQIPATASVLLNYAPDLDIDAVVPDVKFLVAKGVPNLSYRDVSVVAIPARTWESPPGEDLEYFGFMGVKFAMEDSGRFAAFFGGILAVVVAIFASSIFVIWNSDMFSKQLKNFRPALGQTRNSLSFSGKLTDEAAE